MTVDHPRTSTLAPTCDPLKYFQADGRDVRRRAVCFEETML